MKQIVVVAACILLCAPPRPGKGQSPTNTDILLLPMPVQDARPGAVRARNITNRAGYDNQPFFTPDGLHLLYTSIREDGQADIFRFDLATGAISPVTRTPEGEYSPRALPDGDGFSVVRVEADGRQRLWRFDPGGVDAAVLLEDVSPVGYYTWVDAQTVALFRLGEPPTLQVVDLQSGQARTAARNIGRSLHTIPGERAVSFVHKVQDDFWIIKQLDVATGAISILAPTLPGREDFAWTPDGRLLMASGSVVYRWEATQGRWTKLADLGEAGVSTITRMAVSPDGTRLALVINRP